MPHQEPLGPRYRGSRIGRDDLAADESDNGAGRTDSWDEDEDEDENALDKDNLSVQSEGANEIRQEIETDESDLSDRSEALGETDQGSLESLFLNGRRSSGLPGKEDNIDMDVDAFGTSDEGSEGEDEDRMPTESASVDAEARFKINDDDDAFGDEAAGMEETDSSSDEASSEHESASSISNEPDPNDTDERATLRQMMAQSQKTVVATIAEASKIDVAKGEAIAHQRTSFDALLNTRIHLQKGIVSMNSLSSQENPMLEDDSMTFVISNAEAAALRLWNGLEELREAMQANPPPTKKRIVSPATHSTSTAAMWDRMQSHEAQFTPTRRATLTKWSSRLQPLAVDRGRAKLSGTSDHAPLMTVLDQHLAAPNRARLLARTRVPRSCAPVQAAAHISSDPEIYDDADFYATLLRELVDRRMTDSSFGRASGSEKLFEDDFNPAASSSLLPLTRDRKPRGQVDTRASKGRKMRYAVHEKLQNFMAPEDRGTWGERQTTELFAGLLGRKATLREEEEDDEDNMLDPSISVHIDAAKNGLSTQMKRNKDSEEALLMFRRR